MNNTHSDGSMAARSEIGRSELNRSEAERLEIERRSGLERRNEGSIPNSIVSTGGRLKELEECVKRQDQRLADLERQVVELREIVASSEDTATPP